MRPTRLLRLRVVRYCFLFVVFAWAGYAVFSRGSFRSEERGDLCSVPFRYGEMCPKTYRELGGVCHMTPNGSFHCPDIRRKATTSLRRGQFVLTRMLRLFDLVAKKYGIRYWLHSGTLLGAARHNGSLPWEHDADIEMPLEDYVRFVTEKLYKDLPGDIFFQNYLTDPYTRPPHYRAQIDHPDVGHYRRPYNPRLRDKTSCYKYCLEYDCQWHDGLMVDIFILDSGSSEEFPLQEMTFEGFRLPVSKNWLQKLEALYGPSFMRLPLSWNRVPKVWPDPLHACEGLPRPALRWAHRMIFKILLGLCSSAVLLYALVKLSKRKSWFSTRAQKQRSEILLFWRESSRLCAVFIACE